MRIREALYTSRRSVSGASRRPPARGSTRAASPPSLSLEQLRLVVALAGRKGNFGRPIESDERVLEWTSLEMGFGEAKLLAIERVGTDAVPGRQAGPKLGEPFRLLTEADQGTFGLVAVILACMRFRPKAVAAMVGLYVTRSTRSPRRPHSPSLRSQSLAR